MAGITTEASVAAFQRMRMIFNHVVQQGETYHVLFGFSTTVKTTYMVVATRTTTYYQNYIVGFRTNEVVLVPTTATLDGSDAPIFLPAHYMRSVTASRMARLYTFKADGLGPKNTLALNVPPGTNQQGYIVPLLQPDESRAFKEFFKTYREAVAASPKR